MRVVRGWHMYTMKTHPVTLNDIEIQTHDATETVNKDYLQFAVNSTRQENRQTNKQTNKQTVIYCE